LLTIEAEQTIVVEQSQLLQSRKLDPLVEISPLTTRVRRARKASAKAAETEQIERMSKSMSKSPKKNSKK
jgi:hypothetical protein